MFSFPINTQSASLTNNAAASQMIAYSDRLRHAAAQLSELNLQATRRLMEESQSDLQKVMQVRTFSDAQKLFAEHSKSSIEKVTGYWQNVGNIALETLGSPRRSIGAVETVTEAGEPAVPVEEAFMESPAVITKPKETDVHPSPLVEKLVASVAVDAGKTRTRP